MISTYVQQHYYKGFKRVIIDGAPCRVPKWWDTLGNDKEAKEAAKARISPNVQAYYADGIRVIIDGAPCKLPRKPVALNSNPTRRFTQCTYAKTCVVSGHHAGLVPQSEKTNKFYVMVKGKIQEETITKTYGNQAQNSYSFQQKVAFATKEEAQTYLDSITN